VLHAILEIMPGKPDLLVSGINYGENVSTGITGSGTVGAAMEAASLGIPSIAISVETRKDQHLSYSTEVDFSASAHFAWFFGRLLLDRRLPEGVDLLKVDVPSDATPATRWEWTRLSTRRYYQPTKPERTAWDVPGLVGYDMVYDPETEPEGTDVHTLLKKRLVSVTPLTLDLTARVDFQDLKRFAS
jgi:5'-nucleotidase